MANFEVALEYKGFDHSIYIITRLLYFSNKKPFFLGEFSEVKDLAFDDCCYTGTREDNLPEVAVSLCVLSIFNLDVFVQKLVV